MTTDTLAPESETDTVRRFQSIEDMIIFHNPQWDYLLNATLPVRPATEEEAAEFAGRRDDPSWAEIYSPGEPRIVLPPSAPELTALLPVVTAEPAGDPEVLEGTPLPDDPQSAEIQRDATATLARWGADTGSLSAVPASEVHHETVVLRAVPDGGSDV